MVEQFLNHIHRHNLCKTTDKILLAVSGGVDSMVMLHLFRQAGFRVGVAHCNFQLRGEDSMADEALVNTASVEGNIPFHLKRFDTETFARSKGISIQMAARELRYQFFREVVQEHGYDALATAHHLNDSIETVLLNLVRGTGMEGLTGIALKTGFAIRPLLFATRQMILDYAGFHRIFWREDVSNASDDYSRNFIRHRVLPLFRELNPAYEETFRNTLERLSGAGQLKQLYLDQFQARAVSIAGDQVRMNRKLLAESNAGTVLLWELVKDKGFNFVQCRQITEEEHVSGKRFFSDTHVLTIDRDHLILQSRDRVPLSEVVIFERDRVAKNGIGELALDFTEGNDFDSGHNPLVAQLDYDTIRFPLIWRTWEAGDFFIPLGMAQKKKLSDFLIDSKVSVPDKSAVTVLESSDGVIVWVVGFRISDRVKITGTTQRILRVSFKPAA